MWLRASGGESTLTETRPGIRSPGSYEYVANIEAGRRGCDAWRVDLRLQREAVLIGIYKLLLATPTIIMPHRALGIDEILREVAAWVVDTHPPTAVSLACCAKSFEEPALHALWETQTELPTLIKTLPPDCWKFLPQSPSRREGKIVCDLPRSTVPN